MPVPRLTGEQEAARDLVMKAWDRHEKHNGKPFRTKADRLLRRYHNYQELRDEYKALDRPDRDALLKDLALEYGVRLTIPYAFATVETVLPRMLSTRPRPLVLPRNPSSERNVENVKWMVDDQQERISYELRLQDPGKDGLVLGLGVQKTVWRTKERVTRMLAQGMQTPIVVQAVKRTDFDGPISERVDPRDFGWDPFADTTDSTYESCAQWVVHRTWRSTEYVIDRFESGTWDSWDGWTSEDVKALGPRTKWEEVHRSQWEAAGWRDMEAAKDGIHEVLEFWQMPTREHGDGRIVTVLDGEWVCVDSPNPYWHGELPFQVYRPTKVTGQMVGKGEIEPIEDLCDEMDTLRTQRRDNARLKLNAPFVYDEGNVSAADIKFGAGVAIPVSGPVDELLRQLQVGDIPHSSYREEQNLAHDIQFVSGISDTVTGAESQVQQTATGAQLIQAAAGVRIQLKARRLETEMIRPATRHFVLLDQQKIRQQKDVRIPAIPTPEDPERRWAWRKIGPLELAGEFEIETEGGTEPENVPQMRQDAQNLMALMQNPEIDRRMVLEEVMRNLGIRQPKAFLVPDDRIPPKTLEYLMEAAGLPPELVEQAVQYGHEAEEMERQIVARGSDPSQMPPAPPPEALPSGNGRPSSNGSSNGSGEGQPIVVNVNTAKNRRIRRDKAGHIIGIEEE